MSIQLTSHLNANVNLNNVTVPNIATFVAAAMAKKGQFGVQLVTITDEHRLQKRALASILGKKVEVKKVSEINNALFGWDYERVVKNRISRDGGNPDDFQTQAPTGKHWVTNLYGIVLAKDAEPDVCYLRSYQSKATNYRNCYLVDGKMATAQEDSAIRQCLRDPSPSHKQHEAGIEEENEVMPRDYTLANIYGLFAKAWNISFGWTYDALVQAL